MDMPESQSISRVRKNILSLTKNEQDTLIYAWDGIQKLSPDDPNSFFAIASLHGQPFRGAGYGNTNWWGGYCNHGNVLFPTWHRAYLWRLENALRSIKGCEHVTLPYWDQLKDVNTGSAGANSEQQVIPGIFLQKKYTFTYPDYKEIENPLYSYKLAKGFTDAVSLPKVDYSKYTHYETVRYPYSGLVGKDDRQKTEEHNKKMDGYGIEIVNNLLNENVRNWLQGSVGDNLSSQRQKYVDSLLAPNYTAFSNTTSAAKWNDDHSDDIGFRAVVSLESPHNGVHLTVGGYHILEEETLNRISEANGDMGENDTASFDPIFYFHHCFIDRMFWTWQVLRGSTTKLEIIQEYPGTNSVDSQGPTPGIIGRSWLTMQTKLDPFQMTSEDVTNILIFPLGYTYDTIKLTEVTPSTSQHPSTDPEPSPASSKTPYVRASGINRASRAGSFVVQVWVFSPSDFESKGTLIGHQPILSRWHITGYMNYNNHLNVTTYFPVVPDLRSLRLSNYEELRKMKYKVAIEPNRLSSFHRAPIDEEEGFAELLPLAGEE